MTTREASYKPQHDDDSDGELSSSYGLVYQDSLEDMAREAIKEKRLKEFIRVIAKDEGEEMAKEAIVFVLSEIISSKYPSVTAQLIAISCGLPLTDKSLQELGDSIGKTRQSVHSQLQILRKKLGLNQKLRTGKSASAKTNYKLTNQRNFKEQEEK